MVKKSMLQTVHTLLVDRGFQSMITNPTYVRVNPSRYRHYCKGPITVGLAMMHAAPDHSIDQILFAAHIGKPPENPCKWFAERALTRQDLERALEKDECSDFYIALEALANTYLIPTCVGISWMSNFINEWARGRE